MPYNSFITSLFVRPTGVLGRLGGYLMSFSNAADSQKTAPILLENINATQNDLVLLEIGFGPGTSFHLYFENDRVATVKGIDPSPIMNEQANNRIHYLISQGKVELSQGFAESMSFFKDNEFDGCLAMHNLMLWQDRVKGLQELYRVLKHGAPCVVTLRQAGSWTILGDTVEFIEQIKDDVSAAGFVNCEWSLHVGSWISDVVLGTFQKKAN